MIRSAACLLLGFAVLGLSACVPPPEKKPVGPVSSTSKMPWNRPQPGEGQAMYGGALQKR
jgi:hypothetical protein